MISSLVGPCDQLLDLLSYPIFDLSMSYRQIKSEPTIFVMLSYSWFSSSIHHYVPWSDQCYHRVHIIMEFHLHGNLDKLLLSPSTTFFSFPMILVKHPASIGNFYNHYLHDSFVKHMFGRKKWVPLIHVHLMQVAAMNLRRLVLPPLESSQVSHARAKNSVDC